MCSANPRILLVWIIARLLITFDIDMIVHKIIQKASRYRLDTIVDCNQMRNKRLLSLAENLRRINSSWLAIEEFFLAV